MTFLKTEQTCTRINIQNTFFCTQRTPAHKGKLWWRWHHSSKTLGCAKAFNLCKQTQHKQKTRHHKQPQSAVLGDFTPVGVTVTPQSEPCSQARCEWKYLVNVSAMGSSFFMTRNVWEHCEELLYCCSRENGLSQVYISLLEQINHNA